MKGFLAVLDFDNGELILYDCGGLPEGTDLEQVVWDKWGQFACQWMYLEEGLRDVRVER